MNSEYKDFVSVKNKLYAISQNNDLIEIANLSPKLIKSEDEFEGVSDLMSYAEVLGFKPKYYTDIKRDEVDTLIQSTKAYARYMYVNESGIGEECPHFW